MEDLDHFALWQHGWTHLYLLYHYTYCIFPSYRPKLLSLVYHSASIDLNSTLCFL